MTLYFFTITSLKHLKTEIQYTYVHMIKVKLIAVSRILPAMEEIQSSNQFFDKMLL